MKVAREAWSARDLVGEEIVRLILDGTVIKTRRDRKATHISVLAAIGVRRDGKRCSSPSGTGAAKARLPGAGSLPISMRGTCGGPSS